MPGGAAQEAGYHEALSFEDNREVKRLSATRVSRFLLLVVCLLPGPGRADLYRWVDPETGSVKFSSYPPPWDGDAEKGKRAPKVEHIPERGASATPGTPVNVPGPTGLPAGAGAPAASAAPQAASLDVLEQQRKRLILELAAPPAQQDPAAGGAALKKQLETFAAVNTQLDRIDPGGAEKRRAEAQPVLEKLVERLSAQPRPAPGIR